MDYFRLTDSELRERAYHQGYDAGFCNRDISPHDWEKAYRAAYMNGHDHGCRDRAKAQTPAA